MKSDNDFIKINNNRIKIMGVASLGILIFHNWIEIFTNFNNIYFIENFFKTIGFCGVDIFLLLSGMGLANSLKKGTKSFYYNRIKRIAFTYFFSSFFAVLIYKWNFIQTIKNVFFFNFFTNVFYSYLWFVPTIIIFYLFFPLYYKQFDRSKNKYFFFVLSLFIWFVLAYLLKGHIIDEWYGIINRIPIFITGIWLGWFSKEKKFKFTGAFLLINIILLIIGLYLSYLTNYKDFYFLLPISNCLVNYLIALPITIFLSVVFDKCSFDWINNIFTFLGSISFQLYCIQEMFFFFIITVLNKLSFLSIPALLINIFIFIFVIFLARRILFLDHTFWAKIEK